jgi:peptidoglycan hydrolase-like amidase
MARRGSNYREILTHYYPGATVSRADPSASAAAGIP